MKAERIIDIATGEFILLPLPLYVESPLTRNLNKFGTKVGAC